MKIQTIKDYIFKEVKAQALGLNSLISIALGLVTAAILISFGAKITADVFTQVNGSSVVAGSAANNGTQAMGNLSSYLPTLATVGAAAVIIGFLISAFAFGRR